MRKWFKEGFLGGLLGSDAYMSMKTRDAVREQTEYLKRRDTELKHGSEAPAEMREQFRTESVPLLIQFDEVVSRVVGAYNTEDAEGAHTALQDMYPIATALKSSLLEVQLKALPVPGLFARWGDLFDPIEEALSEWSALSFNVLYPRSGDGLDAGVWQGIEAANRRWVRVANGLDALATTISGQ